MASTTLERPSPAPEAPADAPTTLALPAGVRLRADAEGFAALCAANPDLRLERDADGALTVMSPTSSESGGRNMALGARLWFWNESAGLGRVFDSSAGFTFPDGSVLSPDASWIARARWDAVPAEERRRFARVVPDFVAELRSPSDPLPALREKMARYIAQGVRLGWLIDPAARTVEIHRPGREPETLDRPASLSGEDVLPGLQLDLKGVLED